MYNKFFIIGKDNVRKYAKENDLSIVYKFKEELLKGFEWDMCIHTSYVRRCHDVCVVFAHVKINGIDYIVSEHRGKNSFYSFKMFDHLYRTIIYNRNLFVSFSEQPINVTVYNKRFEKIESWVKECENIIDERKAYVSRQIAIMFNDMRNFINSGWKLSYKSINGIRYFSLNSQKEYEHLHLYFRLYLHDGCVVKDTPTDKLSVYKLIKLINFNTLKNE